jgi:hypothetical protein
MLSDKAKSAASKGKGGRGGGRQRTPEDVLQSPDARHPGRRAPRVLRVHHPPHALRERLVVVAQVCVPTERTAGRRGKRGALALALFGTNKTGQNAVAGASRALGVGTTGDRTERTGL